MGSVDDLEQSSEAGTRFSTPSPELPRYRVAIVRNETERLHNPVWDPVAMLEDRGDWEVELFSDHDWSDLFGVAHRFDCIVLSHNVLHANPQLAAALARRETETGLVVMQQRDMHGGIVPAPDLAIDVASLPAPSNSAHVATGRNPGKEVLLNWPNAMGDVATTRCAMIKCLELGSAVPWRSVLETTVNGHAYPVLVRSPATGTPRVIVTTLLLEHHIEAHRKLFQNLVAFSAGGLPETIVMSDDVSWRTAVTRKLRVRGLIAVATPTDGGSFSFERWPFQGAREVFVKHDEMRLAWHERPDVSAWLRNGGRLVLSEGSATRTLHAEPDLHEVARRFSAALQSGKLEWQSSLIRTRAVLEALTQLQDALGEAFGRFGLEGPAHYRDTVRALVHDRLDTADNVDETVSVTAALLDLDRLLNGVVLSDERRRVSVWLRARARTAVADEALEIARALADADLLKATTESLGPEVAVGTASRIRRANLAIKADVHQIESIPISGIAVAEIATSLLVAADYLASWGLLARMRDLPSEEVPLVDTAITTLRKRGSMSGSLVEPRTMEEVAAETVALIALAGLDETPTGTTMHPGRVSPRIIDELLGENTRLRGRLANSEDRRMTELKVLKLAQIVVTIAGVVLTCVIVVLLMLLVVAPLDWVQTSGDVGSALTLVGLLAVTLYVALDRTGLLVPKVGVAVSRALSGWHAAIAKARGRDADEVAE